MNTIPPTAPNAKTASPGDNLYFLRQPVMPVATLTREFRIRLAGEFDVTGEPTITGALAQLAEFQPSVGADLLMVDLSSVSFMDSHGLTALCNSRDLLEAKGWRVYFIRAPRHVSQLFQHAISAGWLAANAMGPVSNV